MQTLKDLSPSGLRVGHLYQAELVVTATSRRKGCTTSAVALHPETNAQLFHVQASMNTGSVPGSGLAYTS